MRERAGARERNAVPTPLGAQQETATRVCGPSFYVPSFEESSEHANVLLLSGPGASDPNCAHYLVSHKPQTEMYARPDI